MEVAVGVIFHCQWPINNSGNPGLHIIWQLLQHHQDSHRRLDPLRKVGCREMGSTLSWDRPDPYMAIIFLPRHVYIQIIIYMLHPNFLFLACKDGCSVIVHVQPSPPITLGSSYKTKNFIIEVKEGMTQERKGSKLGTQWSCCWGSQTNKRTKSLTRYSGLWLKFSDLI